MSAGMSKSMRRNLRPGAAGTAGHDAPMRIGINGSSLIATGAPLGQLVDHAAEAEADGFSSYWLAQLGVPDALTAIAAMGADHEHDRDRHRGRSPPGRATR